jgi:cation transport ATPase
MVYLNTHRNYQSAHEAKIMEISNYSKSRKIILFSGIVICLISAFVICPLERSKSPFITDYIFTYIGLALSVVLILYGFTGGSSIKYLAFILLSAIVSITCWYIYTAGDWWKKLMIMWLGVPSGIVAALVFFVLRYYLFFRNKALPVGRRKKNILLLKQVVVYFVVLLIVSILFLKGGDWIYDVFES